MKFRDPMFFIFLVPIVLALLRIFRLALLGKYSFSVRIPWDRLWTNAEGRKMTISPRLIAAVGYAFGMMLIVIAAARPQMSFNKIKRTVEGIDIMVVLDLSASMRVEDFRNQNRLEVSKPIVRDFILARSNDRIGFEVFSGEAVTLVPPTLDYQIVLEGLKNAAIGDLKDGTAIGDALATAVGRLKESTAKSRVIVLLTDGDSNVGSIDPLTAGELAKGYGIKVYSVAIGREGRVAMPFLYKDVFGRQVKTYQYFDSSINPELLQKISSATGGKFYRVYDNANVLREVFDDIDKLEKTQVQTTEQVKYEERFMPWLVAGLIILALSFFAQQTVLRVYP